MHHRSFISFLRRRGSPLGNLVRRIAALTCLLCLCAGLFLVLPTPQGHSLPASVPSRCTPSGRYQWPLHMGGGEDNLLSRIVRPFDPPLHRWGAGHRGVDIAAAEGDTVLSADAGRVLFAGRVAGKPVVSIEHGQGLRTTYEPVLAAVQVGQYVRAGEAIGYLESGHVSAHTAVLHWGVKRAADNYLNPLRLVCRVHIRLKPVDGG